MLASLPTLKEIYVVELHVMVKWRPKVISCTSTKPRCHDTVWFVFSSAEMFWKHYITHPLLLVFPCCKNTAWLQQECFNSCCCHVGIRVECSCGRAQLQTAANTHREVLLLVVLVWSAACGYLLNISTFTTTSTNSSQPRNDHNVKKRLSRENSFQEKLQQPTLERWSVSIHTCSTSSSSWLSFSSSSFCSLVTLSRSSTTALQLSSLLKLPKLDISFLKALLSHLSHKQRSHVDTHLHRFARSWRGRGGGGAVPFSAAGQPAQDPLDFSDLPLLLSGPLFLLFIRGCLALHWPKKLLLH